MQPSVCDGGSASHSAPSGSTDMDPASTERLRQAVGVPPGDAVHGRDDRRAGADQRPQLRQRRLQRMRLQASGTGSPAARGLAGIGHGAGDASTVRSPPLSRIRPSRLHGGQMRPAGHDRHRRAGLPAAAPPGNRRWRRRRRRRCWASRPRPAAPGGSHAESPSRFASPIRCTLPVAPFGMSSHHHHPARHLVGRHAGGAEVADVLLRRGHGRDGGRRPPPTSSPSFVVRHAEGHDLGDRSDGPAGCCPPPAG